MVYRRTKISRSTFKSLPLGAAFWPASNTTGAPLIKIGSHSTAGALSSGLIVKTAVADTTIAVVRLPRVYQIPVRE